MWQRSFEDYSSEDIQEINRSIALILSQYIEDFHFYNDRYSPITARGNDVFQKILSKYNKIQFTEFSFSNQERKIYRNDTFIIQ